MENSARKIQIHIRKKTPANIHGEHHTHTQQHNSRDTNRNEHSTVTTQLVPQELATGTTVPVVPARFVVPKKPILLNGVIMSEMEIAYFCMEIGMSSVVPTYSGGLGILAGDTLKSLADLDIPVIGVTLLYKNGYFRQRLDESGWQCEEDVIWEPERCGLIKLSEKVTVTLEKELVSIGAYMGMREGARGQMNPIIYLTTDLPENSPEHRNITDRLYSGDHKHRLLQEAVLGIGGLRMTQKIGATNVKKFHMNEGHSAFMTLELYKQFQTTDEPLEEVRARCVFTTHTPIASGHDKFSREEVEAVLGTDFIPKSIEEHIIEHDSVSMTKIGLNMSGYKNGVARRHGEVTREMFPGYEIDAITNGVYARGWTVDPIALLFDKHLGNWRTDNANLRYALSIPLNELWNAHQEAKAELLRFIAEKTGISFSEDVLTIGFSRRMTGYKRAGLLLSDLNRIIAIAERSNRGIQLVFSGKAHPHDHDGKLIIQDIIRKSKELTGKIRVVYIPDYSMQIAKTIIGGVDLWLNTPNRPQEASGTSGMKAAMNGVPHFSVLDGWWLEGHIEGVTGWSIGPHPEKETPRNSWEEDREDLYAKLEYLILPLYEKERDQWIRIMRQTIALNGSFFTTHRMVEQYVLSAYFK